MSDDAGRNALLANMAVLWRMGMGFQWNPWILTHKNLTFGTVISVADNEQDDVEMDSE